MTSRTLVRTALGAALAALALVWACASGTLGGFASATITNPTDSVASGALAFSHAYPGGPCSAAAATPAVGTNCAASVYPASAPTATSTATDAITDTGTLPGTSITGTARVAGCGPVQFANSVIGAPNGAMLPRVGTTFSPSTGPAAGFGSASFDGASGYASSVGASTEPTYPATNGTVTYGLGIWFRTTSTAGGPLFGFGSNPLAVAATNDRILYLDSSGRLGFLVSGSSGIAPAVFPGVGAYNDGTWHYAWVSITVTRTLYLFVSTTTTLSVDGSQIGTASSAGYTGYAGYWHLGWSPIAGVGRYFAGSLSGFTVDDSGAAPTAPPVNPTSYFSFDSTRTELWPLNDSGGAFDGTTVTGVLPSTTALPGGAAGPCAAVTIAWSTANPANTVTPTMPLASFAAAGYVSLGTAPGPGVTQTSTITLGRTTAANTYVPGLIVYAPLQLQYTAGGGQWSVAFIWSAPAPGTVAGSTFVVGS